jgi:YbbR domain-containing protein
LNGVMTDHVLKMPYRDESKSGTAERVRRGAEGWLRAIFVDDWSLKLLALAITLGLWFGVTGQRTPATVRLSNVQLNFRLPAEMEVGNEPPEKVDVILRGSKESLDRLNSRSLVAFVDVSGYAQGTHTVRLMRDTISMDLPEGVHIDAIDPSIVPLRLESRRTRTVPVEVEFLDKLPDGYELRSSTPSPASVTLRGPQSHIDAMSRVRTEKISLYGLTADTNVAQVPIAIEDRKITIGEPVVSVFLKIGEQRIEKSFSGVSVRESSGIEARPRVALVMVFGDRSAVEKLRAEDMEIILTENEDGSIMPQLRVPPGMEGRIELRSTKPAGFTIVK